MNKPLEANNDELKVIDIPDNSVTMVLKAHGKIYTSGANIGNIEPDTPEEDLNSTLRAINGLGITLQRTIAVRVAGREETTPVPGDNNTVEQSVDVTHEMDAIIKEEEATRGTLYIAGADIKKGDAFHIDIDGQVQPIKPEDSDTQKQAE